MLQPRWVLAVLILRAAWAQAPAYSASQIVNASDYSAGPFAPNSVVTIFGSNLSWYTHILSSGDIAGNSLPRILDGVEVLVDISPAPLLYVSPTQINFLIPSDEITGPVVIRVSRQNVAGPAVTVTLTNAAPALFDNGSGYALATHADGTLLSADSPADPGDIVVVYATGLGWTEPNPSPGSIPLTPATITWLGNLTVYLDGTPLPAFRIKYAGVTPDCVGLYQINVELPREVGPDPAFQIAIGPQTSSGALKIPVEAAPAAQPMGQTARLYR